ncbi:unnamed protein product [Heligmosomoides polygyrus]|uniref:BPTI/Kunitz inhibitor domain-containing protein n=1 Tax=Heligmosomoides polygyrus TaxID=6339 RepID=A0A183FNM1_HELPZ|nr:unnamed protein product [Heligmosomoides polygyrus]
MKILLLLPLLVAYGYCKVDLVKRLRCSAPATLPGPACMGAFKRYTYDKEKGCVEFIYGGCNPSPNNFETLEECIKTCGKPIQPRPGSGDSATTTKVIQPRLLEKAKNVHYLRKKNDDVTMLKGKETQYLHKKNEDMTMFHKHN